MFVQLDHEVTLNDARPLARPTLPSRPCKALDEQGLIQLGIPESYKLIGNETRRATCAALPVSALWRPHDCHQGLRARLRAKMAANTKQFRHVMTLTFCERSGFCASPRCSKPAAISLVTTTSINALTIRCCAPSTYQNAAAAFPDFSPRHFGRVASASRIQSRPA